MPYTAQVDREDNPAYSDIHHGVEKCQRTHHVVVEVFAGLAHGFADITVRGEVNYCIDLVSFYDATH